MEQKQELAAMAIGAMLIDSGYGKILAELAAIKETDFIEPTSALKETDTVLGPMSHFEKAAWTRAEQIKEQLPVKLKELREFVCPSCPACNDPDKKDNAPCKDLHALSSLAVQLCEVMWGSIRRRMGDHPSVGVRNGFVAVKTPSGRQGTISIEVVSGNGGIESLASMFQKIMRS